MKTYCCACGRQISPPDTIWSTDVQASGPATLMGFKKYACKECAEELDENGLYPEEKEECEVVDIITGRSYYIRE